MTVQAILEHPLLDIGALLLLSGVVLAFMKRATTPTSVVFLVGLACCFVDNPTIASLTIKLLGQEVDIAKNRDLAFDLKKDDIGRINLDIQRIDDSLKKQEAFNTQFSATMDEITSSAKDFKAKLPDITSVSQTFAENSKYSIVVYFTDSRLDDAKALVRGLVSAGFKASSIATNLTEVDIGKQDPDTTFVIPSVRLKDLAGSIEDSVIKIAEKILPPGKTTSSLLKRGGPGPVKADVVLYLY